jgi:hypothetical protein
MSWTCNEIKSTLKSVSDVLDPDSYEIVMPDNKKHVSQLALENL